MCNDLRTSFLGFLGNVKNIDLKNIDLYKFGLYMKILSPKIVFCRSNFVWPFLSSK